MTDLTAALRSRRVAAAPPPFSFEWTDLSALVREPPEPPPQLIDDILYESGSHWISGHPKAGKTLLVMRWAIDLIERGHHVIWADYEGGARRTGRRLAEFQAGADDVEEYFHYVYSPKTTITEPVIEAFEDAIKQWPGALVVFDSQAKALRRAGLSEDRADEVTDWTSQLVLHLANEHAAPVVVIDHMTKTGDRGSGYSRGSGAKAADADVSWFVERREEFNRHQAGSLELILWHDRDGDLPARLAYHVTPSNEGRQIVMRRFSADELNPVDPKDLPPEPNDGAVPIPPPRPQ